MPPYYSEAFFNSIKWVRENTPLRVETMATAQWYRVLLEKEVTMMEAEDQTMEFIKSRTELASPNTDWELTWGLARLRGLGSEATSFLWKLLRRILPSEDRVARIIPNSSPSCRQCPTPTIVDLEHCFFSCVSTQHVGRTLLSAVRVYVPDITPSALLLLQFPEQGEMEMPIVWISAETLLYMWGVGQSGKVVNLFTTRSILQSKINLLRETRYSNEQVLIKEIFNRML